MYIGFDGKIALIDFLEKIWQSMAALTVLGVAKQYASYMEWKRAWNWDINTLQYWNENEPTTWLFYLV